MEEYLALASVSGDSRDGSLCLISANCAGFLVSQKTISMQFFIENWEKCAADLFSQANEMFCKEKTVSDLNNVRFVAPLPRVYKAIFASSYPDSHARMNMAYVPDKLRIPLYHRSTYPILATNDTFVGVDLEQNKLDFEAEIAVITGAVPSGANPEECANAIRLVILLNDFTYRGLVGIDREIGYGFMHSKPSFAIAPLAITPSALGDCWRGGKPVIQVVVEVNGVQVACVHSGVHMIANFGEIVSQAAKYQRLPAGTIVSGGLISDWTPKHGFCSLIQRRAFERESQGSEIAPYLKEGDVVSIDGFVDGVSIFGNLKTTISDRKDKYSCKF